MFIGKENNESESKEINYLENEIQPVLCEIMPYLLDKKTMNPVPLMIKKIHEIQHDIYSEAVDKRSVKINYELAKIEQRYLQN
jgi:hypothetical protein